MGHSTFTLPRSQLKLSQRLHCSSTSSAQCCFLPLAKLLIPKSLASNSYTLISVSKARLLGPRWDTRLLDQLFFLIKDLLWKLFRNGKLPVFLFLKMSVFLPYFECCLNAWVQNFRARLTSVSLPHSGADSTFYWQLCCREHDFSQSLAANLSSLPDDFYFCHCSAIFALVHLGSNLSFTTRNETSFIFIAIAYPGSVLRCFPWLPQILFLLFQSCLHISITFFSTFHDP